MQVTQYLAETRSGLLGMVKLTQAQDDILVQVHFHFSDPISPICSYRQPSPPQLQILSDFSYGWQLVHAMTPLMQEQVGHRKITQKGSKKMWKKNHPKKIKEKMEEKSPKKGEE